MIIYNSPPDDPETEFNPESCDGQEETPMSKKFYISDLHLGHNNIIRLDNRPFKNMKEMEITIINK